MSVVDLHPEELLDRDARGELSAGDAERLRRHLALCDACRVERALRADFRAEVDLDEGDFDVQRLLSEVLAPGADRTLLRQLPSSRRSVAARRLRPALFAAATVLVAGVSAAAGWRGLHIVLSAARLAPPSLTSGVALAAETPGSRPAAAAVASRLSPPAEVPPPSAAEVPAEVAVPPATTAARPQLLPWRSVPAPALPPPRSRAPRSSEALGRAREPAPLDAAALFDQANRARRSGDHRRAAELYRTLVDGFPASVESHPAEALLGRLLLEDAEVSRALDAFDAYLRQPGPLEEDVLADRARALHQLGRAADEGAAWRELLERYPASVHADPARARLRELEGAASR